jgi:hypothetical protein
MERKYTIVLCCLALLFLGSVCYAQPGPCGTAWPKHSGSYRAHYFINSPNAQGQNGQGDSAIELYFSTEFPAGAVICGINLDAYDFGGATGQKFKALECRTIVPGSSPACPDWSPTGMLGNVFPVPYVNNWSYIQQYCFAGGCFPTPVGLDAAAVVQYNPGQDIALGCPLVAADNAGGAGAGYFFDAANNVCFQAFNDWWLALVGTVPPPPVEVGVQIYNVKYGADKDDHPFCGDVIWGTTGIAISIHLINNIGMLWGPGDLTMWVRGNCPPYDGYSGTGMDLLAAMSSGAKQNPMPVFVPPGSLGGTVDLTALVGFIAEYSFSCYNFEICVDNLAYGGTLVECWENCGQFNPMGCVDDNTAEVAYYVQYPQVWGDMEGKRFDKNEMPSGEFCLNYLDNAHWDYSGAYPALFLAEIRSEGTLGRGHPNLCPAGLMGTYDPSISGWGIKRNQVFNAGGTPDICFTAPPSGNIYVLWHLDVRAWGPQAIGASTAGPCHKGFGHSHWTGGGYAAVNPNLCNYYGQGLPMYTSGAEYIYRMVFCPYHPLDSSGITKANLASQMPVAARTK